MKFGTIIIIINHELIFAYVTFKTILDGLLRNKKIFM